MPIDRRSRVIESLDQSDEVLSIDGKIGLRSDKSYEQGRGPLWLRPLSSLHGFEYTILKMRSQYSHLHRPSKLLLEPSMLKGFT